MKKFSIVGFGLIAVSALVSAFTTSNKNQDRVTINGTCIIGDNSVTCLNDPDTLNASCLTTGTPGTVTEIITTQVVIPANCQL